MLLCGNTAWSSGQKVPSPHIHTRNYQKCPWKGAEIGSSQCRLFHLFDLAKHMPASVLMIIQYKHRQISLIFLTSKQPTYQSQLKRLGEWARPDWNVPCVFSGQSKPSTAPFGCNFRIHLRDSSFITGNLAATVLWNITSLSTKGKCKLNNCSPAKQLVSRITKITSCK